MKCPSCGAGTARVMETRRDDIGGLFRRRVCDQCGRVLITRELITDCSAIPNWVYMLAAYDRQQSAHEEPRDNARRPPRAAGRGRPA
jgi:transcriptional regulator NrdR family protein